MAIEMDAFGGDSIWRASRAGRGSTLSEQLLSAQTRQTFLSLWSYPNVYTDEGRNKAKGDGKELCDQLVIFGNDVVIFSDKHCVFPLQGDVAVAWDRWYRRAIFKSAKQLAGAAAWIERFSDRIYLDKNCTRRLPIAIPAVEARRVHLVAVTRGSRGAAQAYWDAKGKGSSSSLVINTGISIDQHASRPFNVGWQLADRRNIHVLDESTLEILMRELDTVTDFIRYLTLKSELLSKPGMEYIIPGEEELIATYLMRTNSKDLQPGFPEFPADTVVFFKEGAWKYIERSRAYKARLKANQHSHLWDNLIEYQTTHIVEGTAGVLERKNTVANHEFILRRMAEEPRLTRRALSEAMQRARDNCGKGRSKMTAVLLGGGKRVYVFLAVAHPDGTRFEEYREQRRNALTGYCMGAHMKFSGVREVISLAFEPKGSTTVSVDFMCAVGPAGGIDQKEKDEIEAGLRRDNMWQPERLKMRRVDARELPNAPSLLDRLLRRASPD